MYIVSFCSLIALILTYLECNHKLKNGMLYGFVIITFLGCIHYDYGNDYMNYYYNYKDITSYPFNYRDYISGMFYGEPGWIVLNYIFQYLGGFFSMVAVLNIVQNGIVYSFIKTEVDKKWWILAFFIYLVSASFYLLSFSMMRQEFVMIVFLGLWNCIKKRKFIISGFILYICSFIHISALILIPFTLWGFIPVKNKRFLIIIFVLVLLLLWLNEHFLESIFVSISQFESVSDYVNTYGGGNKITSFGIGFFINIIPLIISIYYIWSNKINKSNNDIRLVLLFMIGSFLIPFGQIIQLFSRISIYFDIFSIAAIPIIYASIKNTLFRNILLSLYISIKLYNYYIFFQSPVWIEKYTTFHTIFEI